MTAPDTETLVGLAAKITPGPWKSSLLMTDLHLERKARISVIKAHWYAGYAVWPDMNGKSVPMVAMTPMCNADNPHDARAIALVPDLLAETITLRAQVAKDKARIERLEAALAALILNIDAGGATLGAMKDARAALEDRE